MTAKGSGRSPASQGRAGALRAEPAAQSQAKPLVPNAADLQSAAFNRKAENLRCAGAAARGPADEREFFAQKIAVTCERTADWLETLAPTVAALCGAIERILRADDEAPDHTYGLCDCVDNDGEHYQSADLAAALIEARKALFLASVDTHPQGGDANAAPAPLSGAVDGEAGETPNV